QSASVLRPVPGKARTMRLSGAAEAIWTVRWKPSDAPPGIDQQIAMSGLSSLKNSAYVRLLFLKEGLPEPPTLLRRSDDRLGHRLVLLAAAAADADSAHDQAVQLDRNATSEDHHPGMVRHVDAEELVFWLAVAAKLQRRDIKGLRREGLVDGDVDAAKPRPIHARKCREIGAGIDDRDIHGLTDLLRFRDPRFNDFLCLFHCHHDSRTPD